MRAQRSRPHPGGRVGRALGAGVALVAAAAVSACSLSPDSGSEDAEPARLTPQPRPDVAAEMVRQIPGGAMRLSACDLLGLSTARVVALTGTDMPDVEPIGTGDLNDICTYGGPGSPERFAAAQAEAIANGLAAAGAPTTWPTPTTTATETATATSGTPTGTQTTGTSTTPEEDREEATIPDTVAAGVVKPRSGSAAALAGQPALLGARYACSEVRGSTAASVPGAPPAAEGAPAPVRPDLASAYIDCVAVPAGGGVEVHTILVADNDVWHVTVIRPEERRSPASEARALAAAHRIGEQILG